VCRLGRGRKNFKTMYHLDVLCLKSIKFPFSKKIIYVFLKNLSSAKISSWQEYWSHFELHVDDNLGDLK